MAIRVRAQLRKWFGRGMYPTAEQFSDLFDSFFHKTEDKIPMSGSRGLPTNSTGNTIRPKGGSWRRECRK